MRQRSEAMTDYILEMMKVQYYFTITTSEKNHVEDTYEAVYTKITEEDVSSLKDAAGLLAGLFVKKGSVTSPLVTAAVEDAYKRLVHPSLEREMRADLTDMADADRYLEKSPSKAFLIIFIRDIAALERSIS